MEKRIILIGGMPTAGKSTLAKSLSEQLHLPWMSTDQIGIIMRSVASREQYHLLFTWEDYTPNFLDEFSADEITQREFAKAAVNWLGVRKLIREDYTFNDGFILEGCDILPHLVAQDFPSTNHVRAVFIGDNDTDRIRRVVSERRDASVQSDAIEKEIGWVLAYSKKLKSQADEYGMPWVDVAKNESDVAHVLDALGLL